MCIQRCKQSVQSRRSMGQNKKVIRQKIMKVMNKAS